MSKTNIKRLIKKAKAKNESALTELYDLTVQKVYYLAVSMVKNDEDALDVVQNTYMKAFDKLSTLKDANKFDSWLSQIVLNECKQMMRKRHDVLFSELDGDEDCDFSDKLENDNLSFSPENKVDYSETKRIVGEIIEGLPDDQRLVVLMYYFGEMSIKEIALELDCSESTVKSRLNYAKKKIKSEVDKLEEKGTKLYGVAPFALFSWALKDCCKSTALPESLSSSVINTAITATGTTAAGTAGTVVATVAKVTIVQKFAAGIAACAVITGGGVCANAVIDNIKTEKAAIEATIVDETTVATTEETTVFETETEVVTDETTVTTTTEPATTPEETTVVTTTVEETTVPETTTETTTPAETTTEETTVITTTTTAPVTTPAETTTTQAPVTEASETTITGSTPTVVQAADLTTGISWDGVSPIIYTYPDGTTGTEMRVGATYESVPGMIGTVYDFQMPNYVSNTSNSTENVCSNCEKIRGDGTNGTCVRYSLIAEDMPCPSCGEIIPMRTCHTCAK